MCPFKRFARICFSPGRNIAVPPDGCQGVVRAQTLRERRERVILRVRVGKGIRALKLNTNRKIIALLAPCMLRDARMPRPFVTGDKLRDVSHAVDDEMRRDRESSQVFCKPGICVEIKLIEKKICHIGCAKLSGRQTDIVYDE